jgi:hypothetical protein
MKTNTAVKNSSNAISKLLESISGKEFSGGSKSAFGKMYADMCKTQGISAYQFAITEYVSENNLLKISGDKWYIKGLINTDAIFKKLREYVDKQDRTKPAKKTKIKRQVFKNKTVETPVLTPIIEAFKKLSIKERLNTFQFNDVSEVVIWLRSQGVEVKAFVKQEL